MKHSTDDDLIRDRFRQLRSETERGGVPDFSAMMDRARAEAAGSPPLRVLDPDLAAPSTEKGAVPGGTGHEGTGHEGVAPTRGGRRRALMVGGWASVAVAATVAALLITDGERSGNEQFDALVTAFATDAASGAWRSPTSSLLDVPGGDLLRSVPAIGGPLRGLDPARAPGPSGPGGGGEERS